MKFIQDKEINLRNVKDGGSVDLLNTKSYADLLLQAINDAPKGESYTIGLFGEWGSGKSSVIKTMSDSVESDSNHSKVKVVNYDAWKYSGDSFRRMFLRQLQKELGYDSSDLMNSFYLNSSEDAHIETKVNIRQLFLGFGIIALLCFAISYLSFISTESKIAVNAIIALGALVYTIINGLFKEVKVNINKPHLFAPEQFEECYEEMCKKAFSSEHITYLKYIRGEKGENNLDRLIIIIDNIDRCHPDVAYSLLTDIKNFLSIKYNIVFVVPVDIDALRKHIIKSSSREHGIEADEFLRKFFNCSIWMKKFQNDELYDFANNLSNRYGLGYKPNTISLVANEFATNPRRVIQLFNNLQIELSNYDETFSKTHEALICKLVILREEFPSFYKLLLHDSRVLYTDILNLRTKDDSVLTKEQKEIISNNKLSNFLIATCGISDQYANSSHIVERILVNTKIENNIPENIRQAYRSADKDKLIEFAQNEERRAKIIDYLQDNLKKMVMHETFEAEGAIHLNVLLLLYENNILNDYDLLRLFYPLDSPQTLTKCTKLFKNKQSLINLGNYLESKQLSTLTYVLVDDIRYKDEISANSDDITNVFYAASVWDKNKCKEITRSFFNALKLDNVSLRQYEYSSEKLPILFSEDVFSYINGSLNSLKCQDEDSAYQLFYYLSKIHAVNKEKFQSLIDKAIIDSPEYDFNNSQNQFIISYLQVLSSIFAELRYLGQCIEGNLMEKLFNKVNHPSSTTLPRRSTVYHSFVRDNASNENYVEVILSFFTNANLLSIDPVISSDEIENLIINDDNKDKVLNSLMYLKGQRIDITPWTSPIINLNMISDIRSIELISTAFMAKNQNDIYVISDSTVTDELSKYIQYILEDKENSELLIENFDTLLNDNRIDKIVREILSSKSLEELKKLPESLMSRSISLFEQNFDDLDISNNFSILQLIASKGSEIGKNGVWSKINPILADGTQQTNQTITKAISVLLSFSALSQNQAEALAANLKMLPDNKLNKEKKTEVISFLEGFQH